MRQWFCHLTCRVASALLCVPCLLYTSFHIGEVATAIVTYIKYQGIGGIEILQDIVKIARSYAGFKGGAVHIPYVLWKEIVSVRCV